MNEAAIGESLEGLDRFYGFAFGESGGPLLKQRFGGLVGGRSRASQQRNQCEERHDRQAPEFAHQLSGPLDQPAEIRRRGSCEKRTVSTVDKSSLVWLAKSAGT